MFKLEAVKGQMRKGRLKLPGGEVETPVFMAVGTVGSVKALSPADLRDCGVKMVLGNTYHLHLRPGEELVEKMGGVCRFMNWNGATLTDSGGFQVFSLAEQVRIDEEGVDFRSHIDGQLMRLDPKTSIRIQRALGADIIMAFDECTPMTDEAYTKEALKRTHRWLLASKKEWEKDKAGQQLFGIIQGGDFERLRTESAKYVVDQDLPGNAIGGESVGFDMRKTVEQIGWVKPYLPSSKPFYAMGAGRDPADVVALVTSGVDMFDCVGPTRLARNGVLFHGQLEGEGEKARFVSEFPKGRLSIGQKTWREDGRVIMEGCDCATCQAGFSRGYLRHLYHARELLYYRLASIHNVRFMVRLTEQLRDQI